jgi:hypothetical protein
MLFSDINSSIQINNERTAYLNAHSLFEAPDEKGQRNCNSEDVNTSPSKAGWRRAMRETPSFIKKKPEDRVFVINSTKHSEWELDRHWLEIQTSDNKTYQIFLPVAKLQEIGYLTKGEEIIIQNEQLLFSHFGYSSFDLMIPRLGRTLIGEGTSTVSYSPVHQGKEVHAIFDVQPNPMEKSLSFKIESGEEFKLFFGDELELKNWQSGQEIEIVDEEFLYEKDPLILLGIKNEGGKISENIPLLLLKIKNLKTNKEYNVKADAYYRWQPREEHQYRVMTLRHIIPNFPYNSEFEFTPFPYDYLYSNEWHPYALWGQPTDAPYTRWPKIPDVGVNGDQVMVLEHLEEIVGDYGWRAYVYKLLNLRTGKVYVQSTTDPTFHNVFRLPCTTDQ